MVCGVQGPKGELSWTFVPEVTLKEVCCTANHLLRGWIKCSAATALGAAKGSRSSSCSSSGSSDSSGPCSWNKPQIICRRPLDIFSNDTCYKGAVQVGTADGISSQLTSLATLLLLSCSRACTCPAVYVVLKTDEFSPVAVHIDGNVCSNASTSAVP